MRDNLFFQLMMGTAVCREGADAGGGGGDAGGGGGDAGGGGGDAGGGGGGQWSPPDGLPDDFRGADVNETLSKVFKGYQTERERAEGLRTKLAGMPAAPKSADEYKFEPAENVKPYFGDMDKDPILPLARQAALKHGLSNEAFGGFINDVYGQAAEAGLLMQPLNPAAEIKGYMELTKADESTAEKDFSANEAFAKGLRSQLKGLPGDENTAAAIDGLMMSLTDTSEGNLLLKALRSRLADSGMRIEGDPMNAGGEHFAKEELRKMAADPRADPKSDKYDEEFRKKLDASYAHHHGNG